MKTKNQYSSSKLIDFILTDHNNALLPNLKTPELVIEALQEPRLTKTIREDPVLFTKLMFGIRPHLLPRKITPLHKQPHPYKMAQTIRENKNSSPTSHLESKHQQR